MEIVVTPALVNAGPMVRAFAALASTLEHVANVAPEFASGIVERLGVDADGFVALRTVDGGFSPEPSERFRDVCAALGAFDRDGLRVETEFDHDWPVLSVGVRSTTVAEAGGAGNAPGGGAA